MTTPHEHYHIGPAEGDGDVVFRQTQTEKQFTFPVGEVAGRPAPPVFSRDAKFAAFAMYPTHTEAAQLKRQRKPLQNRVGVANLETGVKDGDELSIVPAIAGG